MRAGRDGPGIRVWIKFILSDVAVMSDHASIGVASMRL